MDLVSLTPPSTKMSAVLSRKRTSDLISLVEDHGSDLENGATPNFAHSRNITSNHLAEQISPSVHFSRTDESPRLSAFAFRYPWEAVKLSKKEDLAAEIIAILEKAGVFEEHPKLRTIATALSPSTIGPYLFPHATGDRLLTVTLFLMTFFLYDDVMEGSGEPEVKKIIQAVTGECIGDLENEPRSLVRAIATVGARFRGMPASWMTKFKQGMIVYIESLKTEQELLAQQDAQGHHSSVAEFLAWRRPNIGGHVICYLVEYTMGMQMPSELVHSELVNQIQDAWNMIMMYQNDYFSAKSDRDNGKLNLAWALTWEFALDKDAAAGVVMYLHDATVQKLVRLFDQLDNGPMEHPQMQTWARHTQLAFMGFAQFQEEAARYRK